MASYGNIIYDPTTGNITSIAGQPQTKGKVIQPVSATGALLQAVVSVDYNAPHTGTPVTATPAQAQAAMQTKYPDWTPPGQGWIMPAALAALAYFLFLRD